MQEQKNSVVQKLTLCVWILWCCYGCCLLYCDFADCAMIVDNGTNIYESDSKLLTGKYDKVSAAAHETTSTEVHVCMHDKIQQELSTLMVTKVEIASLENKMSHVAQRENVLSIEQINNIENEKFNYDDDDDDDYIIHLPFNRSKLLKGPLRPIKFYRYFFFNNTCQEEGQIATTFFNTGRKYACTKNDILTTHKRRFVKEAVEEATTRLSLKYRSEITQRINLQNSSCSGLPTRLPWEEQQQEEIRDVDFVLFITASPLNTEENTIAWARPCAIGGPTRRPVIGHINFVPHMINSNSNSRVTLQSIIIAEHEITHALGFTSLASTLRNYIDENGDKHIGNGTTVVNRPALEKKVTIVQTPRVLYVAREYFNCTTVDGMEIEDSGSALTMGSHWKKRILNDEALVGLTSSAKLYYSAFTLAALEDMGFYEVNYAYADHGMRWGYNRGCAFLLYNCRTLFDKYNVTEFCFATVHDELHQCTFDRTGVGSCDVILYDHDLPTEYRYYPDNPRKGGRWSLLDYCPIVTSYDNAVCTDGRNRSGMPNMYGDEFNSASRCFYSNLISNSFPILRTTARCLAATCTESKSQLILRVQDQNVYCPGNGAVGNAFTRYLRGLHGSVECPSASEICELQELSGISNLPNSTMHNATIDHAPLNFELAGMNNSLSCEQRTEECSRLHMLREQLQKPFMLCRWLSALLIKCFSAECRNELHDWVQANMAELQAQCTSSIYALSNRCLDSYAGSRTFCTLITDASDAYLRIDYRILLLLYIIPVALLVNFV